MPPSPALRCSPRRELGTENQHRRGHSHGSGASVKAKDDDLALFNDMQMKERENFLLQSNDDLEETLTKLKCFSEYRPPVRGGNNDLLNTDSEKNDYDWLLTPPETPLFPSLDEDEHPMDGHSTRGRHRSQPVSMPSTSMAERSQRSSRSSASPHHRSPSPRCSGSALSRGRASSAPHSSPPAMRSVTPVRRSSTPPNRPSTPRSLTPTHRKMNSGSSMQSSSSGRRGISPSKESRGSSASPKSQEWQANLLGFSSDAPPNLRTSLSDRPASYTRGLSPASRSGREMHSRYNRQSMSPTASRSASSSHSYDLDRFSPHSKGSVNSVISSGDEDMESVMSVSTGISPSPTGKRSGSFVRSKAVGFTKKPSLTPSAFSAPKRSFDSSLRQVDQRKAPQNMFRPLLSSVPPSTFYISKASTAHRPAFSRNSSLTTSSNASSELGACIVPYNEGADHEHGNAAVEWGNMTDSLQEEESVSNSIIEIKEDISCGSPSHGNKTCGWESSNDIVLSEFEITSELGNINVPNATSDSLYVRYDHSNVDHCLRMTICSICNKVFSTAEAVDAKDICNDCAEKDKLHSLEPGKTSCNQEHPTYIEEGKFCSVEHPPRIQINKMLGIELGQKHGYLEGDTGFCATGKEFSDELHKKTDMPGCSAEISSYDLKTQHNTHVERDADGSGETASNPDIVTEGRRTTDLQLDIPQTDNSIINLIENSSLESDAREKENGEVLFANKMVPDTSESISAPFQSETSSSCSSTNIDCLERTGISVLLWDNSSTKGPLVHGRTVTPSLQCVEPSYLSDKKYNVKLNSSLNSSTGSTSLDLGPSKLKGQHSKQKVGIKKSDHAYDGNDSLVKSESLPSLERSNNDNEDSVRTCRNEDEDDGFAAPMNSTECELKIEKMASYSDHYLRLKQTASQTSQSSIAIPDKFEKKTHFEDIRLMDGLPSGSHKLLDSSTTFLGQHQCSIPPENAEVEDCGNGIKICILSDKPLIVHENAIGCSNSAPMLSNTVPKRNHVSASTHSLMDDAKLFSNRLNFHSSSQLVMASKAVLNETQSQDIECPQIGTSSAFFIVKPPESHSFAVISRKYSSTRGNCADDTHEGLHTAAKNSENVEDLNLEKGTAVLSNTLVVDNFACKPDASGTQLEQVRLDPVHSVSETNIPGPMDQMVTHRKHTQTSQMAKVKSSKTDMKFPPSQPWDHAKIHKIPASIEKIETTKPLKLESKCNCSIM